MNDLEKLLNKIGVNIRNSKGSSLPLDNIKKQYDDKIIKLSNEEKEQLEKYLGEIMINAYGTLSLIEAIRGKIN